MKHPASPFTSTNLVIVFHEIPSTAWFVRALAVLRRFYAFVGLADLQAYFSGDRHFNSCCHVTFDDGHVSVYERALPVLLSLGVPATVFLSPKVVVERSHYWFQEAAYLRRRVGDGPIKRIILEMCGADVARRRVVAHQEPYSVYSLFHSLAFADIQSVLHEIKRRYQVTLPAGQNVTLDQLREMIRSPLITIGAHTIDHPILKNETDESAEREIRDSVAGLSALIERQVVAFAYPNGTEGLDFGDREQRLLQQSGVRLAFNTDAAFFHARTNPLSIPRGGCPSLQGESQARTAARILLLPIWGHLQHAAGPARAASETSERKAIRQLGILR